MEQLNHLTSSFTPDFLRDTERLHFALQAAGVGIWEVMLDTFTVSWDDECKALFGLDKQNNLPYHEAIKYIHPADAQAVDTAVQNALRGVDNGKYDMIYRTIAGDDKKLRWVHFTGQAFFDEQNKPFRFAGVARDVTDSKKTELAKNALEESNKEFRQLANSLTELVWTTDARGNQTFASKRWKEFTGLEPSDSDTFQQTVHPDDLSNIIKVWTDCLLSGQPYRTEVRLKKHTGEYYWFKVNGEPIQNEKGEIEKWVGTFTNVNDQKQIEQELFDAFKELEENEATFNDVTNSTPTGLWLSNEVGELTYLNKTLIDWTGLPYDSLLGSGWANAIIEEDRMRSAEIFLNAVQNRSHYDVMFRIKKSNDDIVWCRAAGDPFYRDGVYKGYAGFCLDIDEMININNEVQAKEERFRNIVEQAPMAIGLLKGRDMVIEIGNDKIFEVWGKQKSITGKKLIDALPEIKGQDFINLLENVYDTGEPFFGNGVHAKLQRKGRLEDAYFDFVYTPLRDAKKEITGVMMLATEVTKQILATKAIKESEAKLRSLIESAPAAIGLFVGRDLIVDMPNQAFIDIVGKGADIAGKPLREVMPELESQPFLKILDDVYTSGKIFRSDASQVNILRGGKMTQNYYNVTYSPLLDSEGRVYAILDIAIDVTEAVNSRNKMKEAEGQLRDAVDLAELATWTIDLKSRIFYCSNRFSEWLGWAEESLSLDDFYKQLEAKSSEELNHLIELITTNASTRFQNEYKIVNKINQQIRIIHVQGKFFYNDGNSIIKGVAQDITKQKALQIELERLVQKRTEELAAVNQELQFANEELTSTNTELFESTQQLTRSNEELSQYAYVASHDLQEPLRKIQTFSDRLINLSDLPKEKLEWVKKINQSAERMSLLIKNLLEFSRLIKPEDSFVEIPLNNVVAQVIKDYELIIDEKGAKIEIDELPVVIASELQMYQLFQNIISNALKFTRPDLIPKVIVKCERISSEEMIKYISDPRASLNYFHITVSDNGIGFEKQYADHIFEIFRRLHGRSEYKGSGIGLALCKRIVTNHNGYIYADSVLGKGTTFHIFLPQK